MADDRDEIVELEIADVVYPGRGLARLENMVVFVSGVLVGERVRARITERRRSFAEARLVEVIEPSPLRVEPECPLALRALCAGAPDSPVCPGCSYQHMSYPEEVRLKDAQLTDTIKRLGGGAPEGIHFDPVPAPDPYNYRNKLVLHSSLQKGEPVLGYFGEDNRTIVPLAHCPLAGAEINGRLRELTDDSAFMQRLRPREDLTIRRTEKDGVHHWTGKRPSGIKCFTESTILGDLSVPAAGFFQVNMPVADQLVGAVQEFIKDRHPASVIDLYCGAGIFAIAAAAVGAPAVLGIDFDERAIKAARHNAQERHLDKIDFIAAPAARILRDAFKPIDLHDTVLIVDPPRTGLEKDVTAEIVAAGPANFVYISCAPDTLARDLRLLRAAGYEIVSRRVFDMFPRTAHFESITVLAKRQSGSDET